MAVFGASLWGDLQSNPLVSLLPRLEEVAVVTHRHLRKGGRNNYKIRILFNGTFTTLLLLGNTSRH